MGRSTADGTRSRRHRSPPAERAAARKRERAELRRGRALTRSSSWAEATQAFDAAAKDAPDDARPLAEKGYAELLAGDLAHAEADLVLAQSKDAASKLAAQVAYNLGLGLVREKKGDTEGAHAAFARSFALSPTAAAKGKLGDAGLACAVERLDSPQGKAQAPSFSPARSWAEVVQLTSQGDAEVPDFKKDADARDYACTQYGRLPEAAQNTCTGDKVQIVNPIVIPGSYEAQQVAVVETTVARSGAPLLWADVGLSTGWPGSCIGAHGTTVAIDDDVIVATVTDDGQQSVSVESVEEAKEQGIDPDTVVPNTGDPNDGPFCGDGPGSVTYVFYDLKSPQGQLLAFTVPLPVGESGTAYSWKRNGEVVEVTGPSCDLQLKLDRHAR